MMIKLFGDKWDQQAEKYHTMMRQMVRCDGVYKDKYLPILKKLLRQNGGKGELLDLGCGEGTVTSIMASWGYKVMGVDSASGMIKLAVKNYPQMEFQVCPAEKLGTLNRKFDQVVSNMAVHDMKDLNVTVKQVGGVLKSGGGFVFSIAHPCFFTKSSQDYFLRKKKIAEVSKYRSLTEFNKTIPGKINVKHYHRTLSEYFEVMEKNSFKFVLMREVFDDAPSSMFYELPMCLLLSFQKEKK